jgi:hypothetical protein
MATGASRTAAPANTAATIFLEKRVPVDEVSTWLSASGVAQGIMFDGSITTPTPTTNV